MSTGKKWQMTKKELHKQLKGTNWYWKVGGGKRQSKQHFSTFKWFRNKKYTKKLINEVTHLSMRKLRSREIRQWS